MERRPRLLAVVAAIAALAALGALGDDAAAGGRPELVLNLGRTLAAHGDPGGGGVSLGLSALWPVEGRFRAGGMVFVDGLGERRARLVAPGGEDLGPVAGVQRAAQGAALRVEGHAQRRGGLEAYVAATWGIWRVQDDVRGAVLSRDDAAGFGLGVGLLRRFNDHHAAGLALRAHELSRGDARRYAGAALEWRWSMGAGE